MKWYFASNDKSPEFAILIKAAVNSAIKNTTIKPFFIYDGKPNELARWLEEKSVKTIYHRIRFYEALENHFSKDELKIPTGAFFRSCR